MPPTIMILGAAGCTGRALTPLLLAHSDARLLLCGRNRAALERAAGALAQAYPGRVGARVLDAADLAALEPAFAGADLVLVTAPVTRMLPELARRAASAGADLLDIQYSPAKVAALRALDPVLAGAGRTVITDGGFHPGMAAVLARAAGRRLDVLHSALIGSVIQEDWRDLPMSLDSAREFVQLIAEMRPGHVRDGRWTEESYTSRAGMVQFDFGPPFGRRTCYAMGLDEMRLWAAENPQVRQAGFYVGGFNPVVDWLLLPLIAVGQHVAPRATSTPLARLLTWGLRRFTRPPFGTLLRVEAEGERAGRPERVVISVAHRSGYDLTALAVAATVLQWLDGGVRRPGVQLQALAVDPDRFLDDVARMGATVSVEGPAAAVPS